jgi:hypothetical protein
MGQYWITIKFIIMTNLCAHKEREYNGTNAGEQLPDPDLPADIRDSDTSCENSNE